MHGWVGLEALELQCRLGVTVEERAERQPVFIDLAFQLDLTNAGAEDALETVLDYRTIRDALQQLVAEREFNLIEYLAVECLKVVRQDRHVLAARLKLRKPGALSQAASAFVELQIEDTT